MMVARSLRRARGGPAKRLGQARALLLQHAGAVPAGGRDSEPALLAPRSVISLLPVVKLINPDT